MIMSIALVCGTAAEAGSTKPAGGSEDEYQRPVIRAGQEAVIMALVAAKDAAGQTISELAISAISVEQDTIVVTVNDGTDGAVTVTLQPGAAGSTSSFQFSAEFDDDNDVLAAAVARYVAGIRARDDGTLYTKAGASDPERPGPSRSSTPALANLGGWWWAVWIGIIAVTMLVLWPTSEHVPGETS